MRLSVWRCGIGAPERRPHPSADSDDSRRAAEHQIAGIPIGMRQRQFRIGIEIKAAVADPRNPGVRVVHRRCLVARRSADRKVSVSGK